MLLFLLHMIRGCSLRFAWTYSQPLWRLLVAQHVSAAGGILQQSWQENLLELETKLARSKAPWKLVIGHHPVRRNNRPDNNMDLLPTLEPILEKYGVQAYFCGHEHNLQYIHQPDSSVHYVITGGGSLTDYTPIIHYDNGGSEFQYWGSGEMRPDFIAQQATVQAYPDCPHVRLDGTSDPECLMMRHTFCVGAAIN